MSKIRDNAEEIFKSMLLAESEPDMPKNRILNVVFPLLDDLGMDVTSHDNDGNPCIYASTVNSRVLLSGHLDTVKMGAGWHHSQAEEIDGKIYGRGSLDMKGPCVSMLIAAEQLISEGIGVTLAFTTDEEVGMAGAKIMASQHPEISDIPLIIICEPTDLKLMVEEKGLVQFKIIAHGKNAHGSMPEEGRNAITDLTSAVNELMNSGIFGKSGKDPVTANLGIFQGGTLINMIPDRAEAEFDVRYSPDHTGQDILDVVKEILDSTGIDYEIEITREIRAAKSELDPKYQGSLEDIFGPGESVPYATEMAVFCELNPRVFIMGAGETTRAHKPDEFMSMDEIMEGAEAIIKCARLIK